MLNGKIGKITCFTCAALACWLCLSGFLWWDGSYSREYKELTNRASAALEKRMWNDALTALEELKIRYPANVQVRLNLAYLYREVGLLPQAREDAEWSEEHLYLGKKDLARRALAWINYDSKLYEDALGAIDRLDEKTRADWALEAKLWIKKGNWDHALDALKHLPNDDPRVDFWKSWCFYKKGDREALAKIVSKLTVTDTKEPWQVLARMAAKALAKEKVDARMLGSFKKPRDLDESDRQAWKLLEKVKPE